MTDLVVISLESWDQVWRRNQHLVAGLLRSDPGLRVLFVEPPRDPMHDARRRLLPRRGRGLLPLELEGAAGRAWIYQPTKWLPRRVDPGSDRRAARAVSRVALRLGFVDPLLWVNDPMGAEVLALTGWPAIYDITDDWLAADRPDRTFKRIQAHEDSLLSSARVVVCSENLLSKARPDNPAILIPNAVDTKAYKRAHPRPHDLPHGPVALYLGTLHRDRLDVDLCVEIAHRLGQEGHLVLVGPNALGRSDTDVLREAGVHVLGARPSDRVPAYLQHADVLVVPHVLTPFTESLDPIKAYEYGAAARPVVSTDVPGFRGQVDGVLIAGRATFAELLATALADPPPAADPSNVPDWSVRVGDFRRVLHEVSSR